MGTFDAAPSRSGVRSALAEKGETLSCWREFIPWLGEVYSRLGPENFVDEFRWRAEGRDTETRLRESLLAMWIERSVQRITLLVCTFEKRGWKRGVGSDAAFMRIDDTTLIDQSIPEDGEDPCQEGIIPLGALIEAFTVADPSWFPHGRYDALVVELLNVYRKVHRSPVDVKPSPEVIARLAFCLPDASSEVVGLRWQAFARD